MVIQKLDVAEGASLTAIRYAVSELFWSWYLQHSDDVLLEKKFLWFTVKIRLIDIESLFVKLFGSRPSTVV